MTQPVDGPYATSCLMMRSIPSGFNYQMVLRVFVASSEAEARGLAVANAMELHPEHHLEAALVAPVLGVVSNVE